MRSAAVATRSLRSGSEPCPRWPRAASVASPLAFLAPGALAYFIRTVDYDPAGAATPA